MCACARVNKYLDYMVESCYMVQAYRTLPSGIYSKQTLLKSTAEVRIHFKGVLTFNFVS